MIISRDPNITSKDDLDFEKKGTWSYGLKQFLINLLGETFWTQFKETIDEPQSSTVSPIYWTHYVKCYACNNGENVKNAFGTCRHLLDFELNYIKPKLIFGFGSHMLEIFGIKKSQEEILEDIENNIIDRKICLPHPSGGNFWYKYKWEEYKIEVIQGLNKGRCYNLKPLENKIKEKLNEI